VDLEPIRANKRPSSLSDGHVGALTPCARLEFVTYGCSHREPIAHLCQFGELLTAISPGIAMNEIEDCRSRIIAAIAGDYSHRCARSADLDCSRVRCESHVPPAPCAQYTLRKVVEALTRDHRDFFEVPLCERRNRPFNGTFREISGCPRIAETCEACKLVIVA
jgi:hypothetical protein